MWGVCAIVKDEGAHLAEWARHHANIGASHFWIASNDDDPAATAGCLAAVLPPDAVTVRHQPGHHQQMAAYEWGADAAASAGCPWVAFIDADEFLIPVSASVAEVLASAEGPAVAVNWAVFAAPMVEEVSRSVLESNVSRLPFTDPLNTHVKLIARPEQVVAFTGPHTATFRDGALARTLNGQPVDGPFAPPESDRLRLHHYFIRSTEDFALKIVRGRADMWVRSLGARTWEDYDRIEARATVYDTTAWRFSVPCEVVDRAIVAGRVARRKAERCDH